MPENNKKENILEEVKETENIEFTKLESPSTIYNKKNNKIIECEKKEHKMDIWDVIKTFSIGIICGWILVKFVCFIGVVPSMSMYPTFDVNDKLLISRIFNIENIDYNDIIVFKSNEGDEYLIKRVIGMPNDTVYINEEGHVYINGKELKTENAILSNQEEMIFKVPENEYFVMGDNRGNSYDSRYWEYNFVKSKEIKGVPIIYLYPMDKISLLK